MIDPLLPKPITEPNLTKEQPDPTSRLEELNKPVAQPPLIVKQPRKRKALPIYGELKRSERLQGSLRPGKHLETEP